MHANYWFLIDVEGKPTDEDLWGESCSAFDDYCIKLDTDYGHVFTVVTQDNRKLAYEKERLTAERMPDSVVTVQHYALDCILDDCGHWDPVIGGTDELLFGPGCTFEDRLKIMYVWLGDQLRKHWSTGSARSGWITDGLIGTRRMLMTARYPPFSIKLDRPERYRAYDLRRRKYKTLQPGDVFFVADIHT